MSNNNYYDSQTFGTDEEFRITKAAHITKTVQTLFFQFLFTFGCVTLCTFNTTAYLFVLNNMMPLIMIGGLGGIAMVIYMMCASYKTEFQLAIFTAFETMVVCSGSVMYGEDVVLMAMLSTVGITAALGVYALTTKNDHSGLMGPLSSGLTCLLIMGIVNIFFRIPFLHTIELYVGTLIFFGYIVFDIQYFLSEKSKLSASVQDQLHIDAALNIYLDVINVFIRMLEIISRMKGEEGKGRKKRD